MTEQVRICSPALLNRHASTHEVHHRLYLGNDGAPTSVCVQDFDYRDYRPENFLTEDAYDTELAALSALNVMLTERVNEPGFEDDARTARLLAAAGAPLTRQQVLDAALATGLVCQD